MIKGNESEKWKKDRKREPHRTEKWEQSMVREVEVESENRSWEIKLESVSGKSHTVLFCVFG